jgi:hypothetical protein
MYPSICRMRPSLTSFALSSGSLRLSLGEDGHTHPVVVNLTGAPAGTYTALITATVAVPKP